MMPPAMLAKRDSFSRIPASFFLVAPKIRSTANSFFRSFAVTENITVRTAAARTHNAMEIA